MGGALALVGLALWLAFGESPRRVLRRLRAPRAEPKAQRIQSFTTMGEAAPAALGADAGVTRRAEQPWSVSPEAQAAVVQRENAPSVDGKDDNDFEGDSPVNTLEKDMGEVDKRTGPRVRFV